MLKYTSIFLISLLAGISFRAEAQIQSERVILAQSDKNKHVELYNFRDTAVFDPLPPDFVPSAERERRSKLHFVNSSSSPDCGPWLACSANKIHRAWTKDFVGLQIECVCTVVKDGSVLRSRITKSSGNKSTDEHVTKLIKTIQFPQLPSQMPERDFVVRFQEYTKVEMLSVPFEQPAKARQKKTIGASAQTPLGR